MSAVVALLFSASWDLADAARRQITLLSGQAAVAITALVSS